MNRLLDLTSNSMQSLNKKALLEAIANSEGRVMMAETIGTVMPMLGNITNAEFVAAMGVEMITLNVLDVDKPTINGLTNTTDVIGKVAELTGRIIGINLEPVGQTTLDQKDNIWALSSGRKATVANAKKALAHGVRFITLTGNPGVGVDKQAIATSLLELKEAVGQDMILIAGKMHASGIVNEANTKLITIEDVTTYIDNGADIILLPAPGTIGGITQDYIESLISYIHQRGKLAMTAIGTSQEGADVDTIKRIAIMCKMAGADIHHLGDAGYLGMALPENIFAYSVAIRGIRHTYRRMAMSIKR